MELISCRSPVWANEEHTSINCWVVTSIWKHEGPYNAVLNHADPFIHALFGRCASGEFGPVGPYCPQGSDFSISHEGILRPWIAPPDGNIVNHMEEIGEFFAEANAENERGTVRGVALVWAALLESLLLRFIEAEMGRRGLQQSQLMPPFNKKNPRAWTFSERINIAIKKSLLDENLGAELHSIRKIRNCIAHEWSLSFDNPVIEEIYPDFQSLQQKYVPDLVLERDLELLIKMVYTRVCGLCVIQLVGRL